MKTLAALLQAMRPKQWTKNLLVFAALIFAQQFTDPASVGAAVGAFVIFCMLSGAMYLVNDSVDAEKDRLHPTKRNRPIAAGRLSVRQAVFFAVVIGIVALAAAYLEGRAFFRISLIYVGLTLLYSGWLKRVVILDVLSVATGFLLRALGGAVAISAEISPWLVICTALLALFLVIAKRRGELTSLGDEAANHRGILSEYSPALLDQMIAIVTAATLMSYCLYTISDRTVEMVGSTNMMFTIPFVMYGIFRYLYLVHQKGLGDRPDRIFLSDLPILLSVIFFCIVAAIILHFGGESVS